jgi:hypothetical protein
MTFSGVPSCPEGLNEMEGTLGVFADVHASDDNSVELSENFHHLAHFAPVISGDDFDYVASNDCPAPEGLLHTLALVLLGEMVRPLGLVEAVGQRVQQPKQHDV